MSVLVQCADAESVDQTVAAAVAAVADKGSNMVVLVVVDLTAVGKIQACVEMKQAAEEKAWAAEQQKLFAEE